MKPLKSWLAQMLEYFTVKFTSTASEIISFNTSDVTGSATNYSERAGIASIQIRFTNNVAISVPAHGNLTDIKVGTVVSGKRPLFAAPLNSWGNNAGFAVGYINTDGTVYLCFAEGTGAARTIAAGQTFDLCGTYVLGGVLPNLSIFKASRRFRKAVA